MTTINDVSRRANVSVATVSRVLNRPNLVNPLTRMRVMRVIEEMDYRPHVLARNILQRHTYSIGLMVSQFASDYNGALVAAVERSLTGRGVSTLVVSSGSSADGERRAMRFLAGRGCDALILQVDFLGDEEISAEIDGNIPIIFLNRFVEAVPAHCVHYDNLSGGAAAAAHLVAHGHRRLAMITGPLARMDARERTAGFSQECARHGIELDPALVLEGNFLIDGGERAGRQLLERIDDFTAVFCQNDTMAIGLMDLLRRAGVDVPGRVSVIGFDDLDLARHLTPRLTTVRQPLRDIGTAAGDLAFAIIERNSTKDIRQTHLPEIVPRETVAAPRD